MDLAGRGSTVAIMSCLFALSSRIDMHSISSSVTSSSAGAWNPHLGLGKPSASGPLDLSDNLAGRGWRVSDPRGSDDCSASREQLDDGGMH